MSLLRFLALSVCLLLTACDSSTSEVYLFGWANSCYNGNFNKSCSKLKAYDKVNLSVNVEKQSVSYVKEAYNLNESNTVFTKLENCNVVDVKNFSCDGLVKSSDRFLKTDAFKDRYVTESYLLSLTSYFGMEIQLRNLLFVNEHLTLVNIAVFLIFISVLGWLTPSKD